MIRATSRSLWTDAGPGAAFVWVRFLILSSLALTALPLFASHIARELFVPVAGRGVAANGRTFYTTLWITNESKTDAEVRIDFLRSGQANPSPSGTVVRIAAGSTRLFDPIDESILHGATLGAIRLRSSQRIAASALTMSRTASEPPSRAVGATFAAMAAQSAIATSQNCLLQGLSIGSRQSHYRIFVVETVGEGLAYSLILLDLAGKSIAQRAYFVGPFEHHMIDVNTDFPGISAPFAVARIRAMNGDGRIIVAGSMIPEESRDAVAFEMTFTDESRTRVSIAEVIVYVAVAMAIAAAAVMTVRK